MEALGFLFVLGMLAAIILISQGSAVGIVVAMVMVVALLSIAVAKRKPSGQEKKDAEPELEPGDGSEPEFEDEDGSEPEPEDEDRTE